MSERNGVRLPQTDNFQNQNPYALSRQSWRSRPQNHQAPLTMLSDSLQNEEKYKDEYMDEILEESEDNIVLIDSKNLQYGQNAGGYTQMRKSEFFSKRLKKETSATRLPANSNRRMIPQSNTNAHFGGSQQNWMQSGNSALKGVIQQKPTIISSNGGGIVGSKQNVRKMLIASRDIKHRNEFDINGEIQRQNNRRKEASSPPLQGPTASPDVQITLQKQQVYKNGSSIRKNTTKFQMMEQNNVYAEQDMPILQKIEMYPARNTVYGVPFLDQQYKNKVPSSSSQHAKGKPNVQKGSAFGFTNSQEFEQNHLNEQTGKLRGYNQMTTQSVSSLSNQPTQYNDNYRGSVLDQNGDVDSQIDDQKQRMKSAVSQPDEYENTEILRGNQQDARKAQRFLEPGGKKVQVIHKAGGSVSGISEPQTPRKMQSSEVEQLKLSDSQQDFYNGGQPIQENKQKVQRTTRGSEATRAPALQYKQIPHEYSPEYNRNVSLTTAATITNSEPMQQIPAFQIQISKKQHVEKFLTKEVKPEQTSLLFYNFNDYGQKGNQDKPANQIPSTGDRVPSRQVTRGGSRGCTRGSSIGMRAKNGLDGENQQETSPHPGMMTNPYEFGPPVSHQQHPEYLPIQPQNNVIYRIGSPFSDFQRKQQPGLSQVVVQRHKHGKVVLPTLPKKSKGDGDRANQNGQEGGRSPLRTTNFGVIMEMIEED